MSTFRTLWQILAAKGGGNSMDDAFEILAEETRPMLLAYLTMLVRDRHLAEDLVQETLLAAHQNLSQFQKGSSFGAWVRGIARYKALEGSRAKNRRRIITDSRVVEGMEDVYTIFDRPHQDAEAWPERIELMRECIDALSETLRVALVRVYGEGADLKTAANLIGISFQTLAQRLHRAREMIRDCVRRKLQRGMP